MKDTRKHILHPRIYKQKFEQDKMYILKTKEKIKKKYILTVQIACKRGRKEDVFRPWPRHWAQKTQRTLPTKTQMALAF